MNEYLTQVEELPYFPTFMKGVPGVEAITNPILVKKVQEKALQIIGWDGNGYPGTVPVPMDKDNIQLFSRKEYVVSLKADGTHYLCLIDKLARTFFVNRNNDVFGVTGMTFPAKDGLILGDTLLAGEMVLEKFENGVSRPSFLVFDIIQSNGQYIGNCNYKQRIKYIQEEIEQPRNAAVERGIINTEAEPFGIRLNPSFPLQDTKRLLATKEIKFETDGLIFTPVHRNYNDWSTTPGVADDILKWKPSSLNTIDFYLKIVASEYPFGELFVQGLETPFATIELTSELEKLDGKIIECKIENDKWIFLRERWDKAMGNTLKTAMATVKSIRDEVTETCLLKYIEETVSSKHELYNCELNVQLDGT